MSTNMPQLNDIGWKCECFLFSYSKNQLLTTKLIDNEKVSSHYPCTHANGASTANPNS
jgi:hypothetical protein